MDTEKTLGREVKLEDRDSAEPRALVALLRMLADRSPLSPEHTQLLLGWMTASHTGDRRIKALLPAGTVVADKTGTSGTGRPVANATNDAALITLPDGRRLALVVMVADSAAPAAERERVIAEIGKAVYDAAVQSPGPTR
jgi:beta-lactamase class A